MWLEVVVEIDCDIVVMQVVLIEVVWCVDVWEGGVVWWFFIGQVLDFGVQGQFFQFGVGQVQIELVVGIYMILYCGGGGVGFLVIVIGVVLGQCGMDVVIVLVQGGGGFVFGQCGVLVVVGIVYQWFIDYGGVVVVVYVGEGVVEFEVVGVFGWEVLVQFYVDVGGFQFVQVLVVVVYCQQFVVFIVQDCVGYVVGYQGLGVVGIYQVFQFDVVVVYVQVGVGLW